MEYQFPPDVDEQIQQWLASGRFANEDDVLRNALKALQASDDVPTNRTSSESPDDLLAIAAALRDMEEGDRGVAAGDHLREMRTKYGLPVDK